MILQPCAGVWEAGLLLRTEVPARVCPSGLFQPPPDRQELVAALPPHGFAVEPLEIGESPGHGLPGGRDGGSWFAMGTADRLGNDAVDDAERREVGCSDLHVGG